MPKRINNGTRMHVIVPEQHRKALERYSKKTGLTVSEHLRRAIDLYLASAAERLSQRP